MRNSQGECHEIDAFALILNERVRAMIHLIVCSVFAGFRVHACAIGLKNTSKYGKILPKSEIFFNSKHKKNALDA